MIFAFTPSSDVIQLASDFDGTPTVWILTASDMTVMHGHHTHDPIADLLFWAGTSLN